MHQNDKYEKFFHKLEIAKVARDFYSTWVESCRDLQVLLQAQGKGEVREVVPAVRLYFSQRTDKIVGELSADLTVTNFEANSLIKALSKLLKFI